MRTIKNLLLILAASFVITGMLPGCGKVTYRKTAGGLPYQLFGGNSTQKIAAGNVIKVNLTYKVKDSVYFSSFGKLPVYIPVNQTSQPYDISEVWTSLKVGDSVIATQMMDTFIRRSPANIPPNFKKGDRIITTVKVLGVFTSDSAASADEEKGKKEWLAGEVDYLGKYLAGKNITATKTPSGAYVQIINPGTGNLIDSGKYVSVNYTGSLFSGKKFDSNVDTSFHHIGPYSFIVDAAQMIKGFDEAVQQMKAGGTARAYVPSILGYGANPDPRSGIKPFENLIFDITIVDVKDKAPEEKPAIPPRAEIKKVDGPQPKK